MRRNALDDEDRMIIMNVPDRTMLHGHLLQAIIAPLDSLSVHFLFLIFVMGIIMC